MQHNSSVLDAVTVQLCRDVLDKWCSLDASYQVPIQNLCSTVNLDIQVLLKSLNHQNITFLDIAVQQMHSNSRMWKDSRTISKGNIYFSILESFILLHKDVSHSVFSLKDYCEKCGEDVLSFRQFLKNWSISITSIVSIVNRQVSFPQSIYVDDNLINADKKSLNSLPEWKLFNYCSKQFWWRPFVSNLSFEKAISINEYLSSGVKLKHFLNEAFIWELTPEGKGFWKVIADEVAKYIPFISKDETIHKQDKSTSRIDDNELSCIYKPSTFDCFELPQKEITHISDREIETALVVWSANKGYLRKNITVSNLAKELDINLNDFKHYIENDSLGGLDYWVNRSRIDASKDELLLNLGAIPMAFVRDYGFNSSYEYLNSFLKFKHSTPDDWAFERLDKMRTGQSKITSSIQQILDKVSLAVVPWANEKEYLSTNITFDKLVSSLHVSERDFRLYLFFQVTGSYVDWVNSYRIEYAKILIQQQPDITLQLIAPKVGFLSTKEFVKAFNRFTGVNFRQWKYDNIPYYPSFKNTQPSNSTPNLESIRQLIQEWIDRKGHCSAKTNMAEAAAQIGITVSELKTYLDTVEKTDFYRWRIEKRIEESKKLLLDNPSWSLEAVALASGFSDRKTFHNSFKGVTGLSPSDWREEYYRNADNNDNDIELSSHYYSAADEEIIKKWIENKGFCEPRISIDTISSSLGITESAFASYCYKCDPKGFRHWLNELRIEEAKSLLIVKPPISLYDVKKYVGFLDYESFINIFTNSLGTHPGIWRYSRKAISDWKKRLDIVPKEPHASSNASDDKHHKPDRSTKQYSLGDWKRQSRAYNLTLTLASQGWRQKDILHLITEKHNNGEPGYTTITGAAVTAGTISVWVKDLSPKSTLINNDISSGLNNNDRVPFSPLDVELISAIEKSTEDSRDLLSTIFVDDEGAEAISEITIDQDIASVLTLLLKKNVWPRSEVEAICQKQSMLIGYVLEQINDYAIQKVDDILIEDSGDLLYVATEYKDKLI